MKWMLNSMGAYAYGDIDALKLLREAFQLNNQLPEGKKAEGIQDAEIIYALALEALVVEHRQQMMDKELLIV